MPKKNRNLGGRPKGLPKTGGRQKGTPNKSTLRLRELFSERGFDFVDEVTSSFKDLEDPKRVATALIKIPLLTKLAPYFMQRLRQEGEATGEIETTPEDDERVSTEALLKLAEES